MQTFGPWRLNGEPDLEAAATARARQARDLAAMPARDLADQAEAEAGAALGLAGAADPVEGREDQLALVLGDARAAVADPKPDRPGVGAELGFDRRSAAMAIGVFEQVADHPPKQ